MVTTVTDNSPQSINTSLFAMDGEIQKVKKITESFDEKLSGIDIETGVLSVNGKQGVVELTASDVDALPDTTVIPTTTSELENTSGFITINDVGASFVPVTRKVNNKALSSDITLTASDVGALPDTTVIPTKTSQLTNDSGFITSSGSITGNAATATRVEDGNNVVQYKATSLNGFTIQDTQEKALYVEGREGDIGDSGGIAITNDGVTVFGAGDTDGVLRVINEDNVSAGPVFKVMKDGQVYTTNTIHGSIDATSAGIRIPTSQPSSLADGDIWIS